MESMCGIILSAGFGKRLRPLTNRLPKPLLPILGIPLIDVIGLKLLDEGAVSIHINAFHMKEKIIRHAENSEIPFEVHVEKELLGTGGGIANMKQGLSRYETLLLHNGDIISNFGFGEALKAHKERDALITMLLLREGPCTNVLCSGEGVILKIESDTRTKPADGSTFLGYSGMSIISTEALPYFPDGVGSSLVDVINSVAREEPARVIYHLVETPEDKIHWFDIGSPSAYHEVHRQVILDKVIFHPSVKPPALPIHICEGASVEPGVEWRGFLEIQRNAVVKKESYLENCIVMEGTTVEKGTRAVDSIITGEGLVECGKT